MRTQPVVCTWDGVVLTPTPRYARAAARQFEPGAEYPLQIVESRNMRFHNKYFAAIHEGWTQLPERIAQRFPTSEHLRHWLLIQVGEAVEKEYDLQTSDDARLLAMCVRTESPFARVRVVGPRVIVNRANSQALGSMSAAEFNDSAEKVLDLLAQMIGVPRGKLVKEAGRSA